MNPDHVYMGYDGAVINHGPNTSMDGVVQALNHDPFDMEAMENFPDYEWAQLDLPQDLDNNPEEFDEPAFNEQPPLHIVNDPPLEPFPEPPMAAEPPPMHSPGTNGHRYTCQACPFSSNIKRDYERHSRTLKHRKNTVIGESHNAPESIPPNTMGFHCPVQGCKFNSDGKSFSRDDHLWRHIRKVHDIKKQV